MMSSEPVGVDARSAQASPGAGEPASPLASTVHPPPERSPVVLTGASTVKRRRTLASISHACALASCGQPFNSPDVDYGEQKKGECCSEACAAALALLDAEKAKSTPAGLSAPLEPLSIAQAARKIKSFNDAFGLVGVPHISAAAVPTPDGDLQMAVRTNIPSKGGAARRDFDAAASIVLQTTAGLVLSEARQEIPATGPFSYPAVLCSDVTKQTILTKLSLRMGMAIFAHVARMNPSSTASSSGGGSGGGGGELLTSPEELRRLVRADAVAVAARAKQQEDDLQEILASALTERTFVAKTAMLLAKPRLSAKRREAINTALHNSRTFLEAIAGDVAAATTAVRHAIELSNSLKLRLSPATQSGFDSVREAVGELKVALAAANQAAEMVYHAATTIDTAHYALCAAHGVDVDAACGAAPVGKRKRAVPPPPTSEAGEDSADRADVGGEDEADAN